MASIPDEKCNNESNSLSGNDPSNNLEETESPDSVAENSHHNSVTDLFGSKRPISICSPFGLQNSHKPVFGSSRSILKPSTLFTDANLSSPSVTFGNYSNKTVKLKPSVLANPFQNSSSNKSVDEITLNCDDKTDTLPSVDMDSKNDVVNYTQCTSAPVFVPLNDPVSSSTSSVTSSVSSTTVSSTSTTTPIPCISTESACSTTSVSSEFIFGQNLHERVAMEKDNTQESVTQNGITFSEMLFSSAIKQDKEKENVSHEFSNGNTKTLSMSAKEYEEARSVKRKYEEVTVVTGEEDEQNILQINCKLFAFDNTLSSWTERGRGTLRLNDKESSEGRSSRLVMRLAGNLRVVLNTKVWGEMNVELASKKSVRLTAIDQDGQVRIYLVTAQPKDSEQLYSALSSRIQKKKQKTSSGGDTSSTSKNE